MTKPYARGATRGGGRSDIFLGLGSKKTPNTPSEIRKSGPISGSPFRLSDTLSYRTSRPWRFRGDSFGDSEDARANYEDARANYEDARAGVPNLTNCSRPILPLMSCSLAHGVATFGGCVTWPSRRTARATLCLSCIFIDGWSFPVASAVLLKDEPGELPDTLGLKCQLHTPRPVRLSGVLSP